LQAGWPRQKSKARNGCTQIIPKACFTLRKFTPFYDYGCVIYWPSFSLGAKAGSEGYSEAQEM